MDSNDKTANVSSPMGGSVTSDATVPAPTSPADVTAAQTPVTGAVPTTTPSEPPAAPVMPASMPETPVSSSSPEPISGASVPTPAGVVDTTDTGKSDGEGNATGGMGATA